MMQQMMFLGSLFLMWWMAAACGPPTPQQACERGLQANCAYIHRCATTEQKQGSNFEKLFGADIAACIRIRQDGVVIEQGGITIRIQPAQCSEKTEQTYCKDAKTPVYYPEFVQQCFSDFETQTCPDNLLNPNNPASCEKVCQAN